MTQRQGDMLNIELQEGVHLTFAADYDVSSYALFTLTWASSAMLNGGAVRCRGLLPGVSLWIKTDQVFVDDFDLLCESCWTEVEEILSCWVEQSERMPCIALHLPGSEAYLALNSVVELKAGKVEIERQYVAKNKNEMQISFL